jgi:probable glucuronoxylan glucuronosyltransferase IRX7
MARRGRLHGPWPRWSLAKLVVVLVTCWCRTLAQQIYIYRLPARFQTPANDHHFERSAGYALERAIRDSLHYTRVAHHAQYFWIPVYPHGDQRSYDIFEAALAYIQCELPHWNRTNGANHIAVGSWDFGLMQLAGLPAFTRIIHLSHFGWANATKPWQVNFDGGCRFKEGPDCATLTGHLGGKYGVFRPDIDILIPDIMEQNAKVRRYEQRPQDRTTRVFFAGSATNIFRETVYTLFSNETGWKIVNGHVDLGAEVLKSVFCLDLSGAGFSTRFTLAMTLGCVPVMIDELLPPWHGVLPTGDFSITFKVSDLPNLPELINDISAARTVELQHNVEKYKRYYDYNIYGANYTEDAFTLLLRQLDSKLLLQGSRDLTPA